MNALDGFARAMRRLPNVRGKQNVAWWWQRTLNRRGAVTGGWRVTMSGGQVLELPRASSMACAVAASGQWDTPYVDLVRRYITPGSLVVDVGASVGLWTVQLAMTARIVGAEVWAIEPVATNVAWLERNLRLNGLDPLVRIHPIALGSAHGRLAVKLIDGAGGNAYVPPVEDPGAPVTEVRPLDGLERPRRVSFMKLDVEGFELEVLRGARRVLEEDRPVVFGEFSRVWLEQRGEDLGAFLRELATAGYGAHELTPARSRPWRAIDAVRVVPIDVSGRVDAENLLLLPGGGSASGS